MTTLAQLIEEYCPDGVEHVTLGDVVTIRNGSDWKTQEPGDVAVYGSGGKMEPTVKVPASVEPSVLLPRKGSLDVQFVSDPFWNIDTAFRTETDPSRLSMKYFYYLMKGVNLAEISTSATRPSLTQTALKKLVLPLPPREVQDAIVERLDAFAALIESLDSEIALREKCFAYFREQLLSFDELDGVEYVKLGEPLKLKAGSYIKASEISDERSETHRYICVGGNGVRGFVSTHNQHGAYAVIGRQGALCGNVHWFSGDFYATEHAVVVTPEEGVCGRFMFHQLVEMNLRQYATKSAQPGLSVNKLNELPIALPPLEVQQNIVDKLDTMQALIDNLKHERELRKAQFEFYREKLLTFSS
ncbi:restriction endonuclease subunit S [uncultured Corynebacterium sp.]|uniref:restriction endonuclease subunit S n=1 Tax=uncultured Corynebacterium sp. TaxID=159447 RepID=UPI00262CEC24|nr:restriction endonuclease subunit S [uncultured Corynebacterium sp.]